MLADSPRMGEHFDRSFDEVVRRDRNHPSVVIWGLLNETFDGPVFRHAVGYLRRLRELDGTRLVLLSSGRWDGQLTVGSISNPEETTWRHEWGSEAAGAAAAAVGWAHDLDRAAYVPGAGDVHLYPNLPESAGAKRLLRTMGTGAKPVFLSEYGVGSLFDAVTALAQASHHLPPSVTGRPKWQSLLTSPTSGLWRSASFLTGSGSGWMRCTASLRTRWRTASSTSPGTGPPPST